MYPYEPKEKSKVAVAAEAIVVCTSAGAMVGRELGGMTGAKIGAGIGLVVGGIWAVVGRREKEDTEVDLVTE